MGSDGKTLQRCGTPVGEVPRKDLGGPLQDLLHSPSEIQVFVPRGLSFLAGLALDVQLLTSESLFPSDECS